MNKNIEFLLKEFNFEKQGGVYARKEDCYFDIFVDENCEVSFSKPITNLRGKSLCLKRKLDRCIFVYINHYLNCFNSESDITLFKEMNFKQGEKIVFEVCCNDRIVKVSDYSKKEQVKKYFFCKEFDFARTLQSEGKTKIIDRQYRCYSFGYP